MFDIVFEEVREIDICILIFFCCVLEVFFRFLIVVLGVVIVFDNIGVFIEEVD